MHAEAARVQRGEIGRATWQVMGNRLRAHVLPLLGDLPAQAFGTRDAQRLIDRLGDEGFTSTTIAQYLVLLRKVVMHGVHIGVLREAPLFPKVKVRSRPRGSFSVAEYRALIAAARRLRGRSHPVLDALAPGERFWIARELLVMPDEMPWLIRWMVNTFVRPSDIKLMKHKHIEVVRAKHVYLRMNLPETKRHSQPIVSLQPAVRVYERLVAHRARHGFDGADDYIFLPQLKNREHALAVLNFLFHWVLEVEGIEKGPLGQDRTLYCLRHTAITLRLLYGQGIDMLTLARNARTSVNMVERFYASVLNGEMNVGLLQSRRGRTV
jgi:integrase